MTVHIWVSCPDIYTSTRAMFCDLLVQDEQIVINASIRNDQGLPVPQEMCPRRLWINGASERSSGQNGKPLSALFFSGSYWIVSARAADIFRAYDLGEGALYPVSEGIYLSDNVTRIEESFFCWICGNKKESFIQALSRNVKPLSQHGVTMKTGRALSDDDLAVSERALGGPAVWMEKNVYRCVFLAGSLGDELVKAGMKEAFALHRCRVVAGRS